MPSDHQSTDLPCPVHLEIGLALGLGIDLRGKARFVIGLGLGSLWGSCRDEG